MTLDHEMIRKIMGRLLKLHKPSVAFAWLEGKSFGDKTPKDLIFEGRYQEVLDKIDQYESGGFD